MCLRSAQLGELRDDSLLEEFSPGVERLGLDVAAFKNHDVEDEVGSACSQNRSSATR